MYNEETNWISQTVMTYKDQEHNSDGYLRVSISTNTKDYKNYNPPRFGIGISNQYQKVYNLDIIAASDLLKSFTYAFKNGGDLFKEKLQIVKQNKAIQLIIEFTTTANEDLVVKMTIKHGETDFTIVIIPADLFQLFANRLKYFVDKYDDICMRQYDAALQGGLTEILQQLPSLIKQMPSQILPANYTDSSAPPEEVVKTTEMTIEDLDQFVGKDMKNIEVKELGEKKETPLVEVDSPFIKHFIKGDLRNLETILNNTSSVEELRLKLNQDMKLKGDVNMLPGITDDELISLEYISTIISKTSELGWSLFGNSIPSSTPALRYKAKDVTPVNIELAYDLLLFSGYIRTLRRRLEDKIDDANENKALFHLKFRAYLDPFYFSFIDKSDNVTLSSITINRYKYYDSIGVFKEYTNKLEMYKCVSITETDILSYVNEVSEKIIGRPTLNLFISGLHENLQKTGNVRIGTNSNFNKEQIINEILPLEIAEKMGQTPPDIDISDEVKQFFKGKKKVEKKIIKKNHLTRVVGTLENDIPEQYKNEFLEFIDTHANKNFKFDDSFPYQEFGEELIKALYVWKPETDERIKNSLKYYQTQIENELMEKQYILALDKNPKEPEVEVNLDWDL
jgi:hypothetical protein